MELCNDTIQTMFEKTIFRFGSKCAVKTSEGSYTWNDLGKLVDGATERFAKFGIRQDMHVALWSGNHLDWIVTFLAIVKLGAVAVLINHHYTRRELVEAMKISRAEWLCYGDCPALRKQPELPARVMRECGIDSGHAIDIQSSSEMRRKWLSAPFWKTYPVTTDSHKICCLLFTSGSTEYPKCVMMSHYSLVNNAISMAEKLALLDSDTICLSTPLFHIFCLCGNFLSGMYVGAAIAIPDQLKSSHLLHCIKRHHCSILNGVPTSYLALLRNPEFAGQHLSDIRLGVLGGAAILPRQMQELRSTLPHIEFMINYGQTEGGCICNTEYGDTFLHLSSSVGRPLPHISLEIVDPQTGHRLKHGMVGEIVVRGYNVMRGLFPPGLHAQSVDHRGWLHTEDLGRIDADGYLTLVGRKKEIIIRGGEDITPREIENIIMAYEPIQDVKVFGIPHEVLGEQIVACVVPRPDSRYREEELREWMASNLAAFKLPAHLIAFAQFPVSANGKIDLCRLKQEACCQLTEQSPVIP